MYTNNLQLIGNLVDAPEVRVTPAGVVRARFRLASTERRREAGDSNAFVDPGELSRVVDEASKDFEAQLATAERQQRRP